MVIKHGMASCEVKEFDFIWKINERSQEWIQELKHNKNTNNAFV